MNRLVIAPHVDDDVIGCGGILDSDTTIVYCGVDEFHGVSRAARHEEAWKMAERAGVTKQEFLNHKVNAYQLQPLIANFEMAINAYQPDEVLTAWPSYNQDHRTVYEALMVATRPHDKNWFVPRVLLYEEPDCFWPMVDKPFIPNLYRPINIAKKLDLYRCMESQVRGMRSLDHLEALAIVRGAAIMQPFAEAYHILRWVE